MSTNVPGTYVISYNCVTGTDDSVSASYDVTFVMVDPCPNTFQLHSPL